jgi:hypothetical protein
MLHMRRILAAFLCVYLLFAGQTSVRAQSQSTSRLGLYALQTGSFPSITAGLDVFDSTGSVVTGLKPDAITLLEDNQPRPINQLQEVLSGVEFALRSIPVRPSLSRMPVLLIAIPRSFKF